MYARRAQNAFLQTAEIAKRLSLSSKSPNADHRPYPPGRIRPHHCSPAKAERISSVIVLSGSMCTSFRNGVHQPCLLGRTTQLIEQHAGLYRKASTAGHFLSLFQVFIQEGHYFLNVVPCFKC